MKEFLNVTMVALFIVLAGLLISIVDSCRGYEDCLKTHSIKTCKEYWGRSEKPDPDSY